MKAYRVHSKVLFVERDWILIRWRMLNVQEGEGAWFGYSLLPAPAATPADLISLTAPRAAHTKRERDLDFCYFGCGLVATASSGARIYGVAHTAIPDTKPSVLPTQQILDFF